MKTIEMTRTDTCIAANNTRQVFGPKGKQFCVDDDVAETFAKNGSAKIIHTEKSASAVTK